MSLNPVTTKKMTNLQVLSHASKSLYSPSFLVPFIKQTLWNSCLKILVEPHYERNHDQFAKYSQTLWDHGSKEGFCWWLSEWHFGLLTVKFLLTQITTHKMASFGKYCHTPQNHRSLLILLCLRSEQHFGAFTVKLSLNLIMREMMADLQNSVTRP